MRYAILSLGTLLFLFGCDNRKDFYESLNQFPEIQIRKYGTNTTFTPNFSDSIKRGHPDYDLEIKMTDEEVLPLIFSSNVSTDKSTIPGNIVSITFDDSHLGIHTVNLKTTDSFKKEGNAVGIFTVFDNILPVVLFNVTQSAIHDPLEYAIDASGSYDGDRKFGGEIIQYEFMINNSYKVITPYNKIYYIFPSSGLYTISVRAMDNNNLWSSFKTQVISV